MLTISINLTLCIGYACRADKDKNPYWHDRCADKNPYRHDRRADKNTYRQDRRADSQCHPSYRIRRHNPVRAVVGSSNTL